MANLSRTYRVNSECWVLKSLRGGIAIKKNRKCISGGRGGFPSRAQKGKGGGQGFLKRKSQFTVGYRGGKSRKTPRAF